MDLFISGEKATGKTYSLNTLNQSNWLYIFSEKKTPTKSKFNTIRVREFNDVLSIRDLFSKLDKVNKEPDKMPQFVQWLNSKYGFNITTLEGIIFDSVTSFLQIYEDAKITGKVDGFKNWGEYKLLFNYIKQIATDSELPVIFIAHIQYKEVKDNAGNIIKTSKYIEAKGGLKEGGLDRDIGNIVLTKKITLAELEEDESDKSLITITEQDKFTGFKYVYMVSPSIEEKDATIRFIDEIFPWNVRYIDNDVQKILERLK